MGEGKLSKRQTIGDQQIRRCTCGAWKIAGSVCPTCTILRGEKYGMEQSASS